LRTLGSHRSHQAQNLGKHIEILNSDRFYDISAIALNCQALLTAFAVGLSGVPNLELLESTGAIQATAIND
jgi:hypothetical protein